MSFEPHDGPEAAGDDWSGFAPPDHDTVVHSAAVHNTAAPVVAGPPVVPEASPVPPRTVDPTSPGSTFPLGGVSPWGAPAGERRAPTSPPYATTPSAVGGFGAPTLTTSPTLPSPPMPSPTLPPPAVPLGGYGAPAPVAFTVRPAHSSSGRQLVIGVLVGALVASLIAAGVYLGFGRGTTVVTQTAAAASRPSNTIKPGSLDIQSLLKQVRPSVVSIKTGLGGRGEAAGSGVVVSTDGMVLTNAHVIAGATGISVTFADGSTHTAQLIGSFPDNDVALVKAKDAGMTVPAHLGSSDDLLVGDDVVAIGNALNLGADPSVTKGIVSAKDRSIDAENEHLDHLIQTDAAINPGNSGGPLVNANGEVVGINTAIIQSSQNVGFSLAIDSIKQLIDDMKQGKGAVTGDTAFLGVVTTDISEQPTDVLNTWQVKVTAGAFISDVQVGSAAEDAGLEQGDVIVGIDGKTVKSKNDVGTIIRGHKAGDTVQIEVVRRGDKKVISAQLKRRGG